LKNNFILFFATFFLFVIDSFAVDSTTLNGTLQVTNVATFKYKLVLSSTKKANEYVGYSILDEAGTNETKSSVKVKLLKEQKSLLIQELKLISTKSKETSFCFVNGGVTIDTSKRSIKGMFVGKDEENKICGRGIIKFDFTQKISNYFGLSSEKQEIISEQPTILKNNNKEKFNVMDSMIHVWIWDGGIEDGDSLALFHNNNKIGADFLILNSEKKLSIKLVKGDNVISIRSINEGAHPPNSANFRVFNSSIDKKLTTYLKKNESAEIIINLVN
jgi:hypothetical protein